MAFVNIDNHYSSALAIIAGVILTLTRPILSNLVPQQASNPWATLFTNLSSKGVTVFSILAGILSILVQIGGVTILVGGVLCFANHLRIGKELVGFGTTFGLVDLLSSIPSLNRKLRTRFMGCVGGTILRRLRGQTHQRSKGLSLGEVRKLLVSLRSRVKGQKDAKKKRERRVRRLRNRRRASGLSRT